ncbi:RNA polymerase sigma factor [Gorillibacterium massiliense]|uniref:RNA polymerase sigma factor n=1 Tax=Gorillibacterium massiliense TaxID=1280390 RepID=UPI0004B8E892|nr:RNA polymerase sigma factor [Gorillibacterium massiliense]
MSKHLVLLFTTDYYGLAPSLQQQVYYEYYHLVYPLIFFIIKDHGATEDIIQDSFMRAIRKSSQLQDLEKMEGWIKTLARNTTLNHIKKFSRNRNELDSNIVYLDVEHPYSSPTDPLEPVDKQVELRMMKQSIAFYMDQLRPDYRQIIEMRWIHDMSYKEIAATLRTTEGAVKQKLFRAREQVKQRLQNDWGLK